MEKKKILSFVFSLFYVFLFLSFALSAFAQQSVEPKQLSELPNEITRVLRWVKKDLVPPIAGFALLVAGIIYMFSGANPQLHNQAKDALIYIVVGLLIIWGVIELVNFILENTGIPKIQLNS
jgi:hypothetical protein